ncbi:MAG: bifunctional 4-hydroxy-3-methylbut-2-enyl diphosphate reductase/30S ribosomal protein S1 [Oscillospiraceae bacterium]|nr:bifunctional 4-hydroxy-3-methylbut-2-enyl diphosphate reductase/30S ribosomal protein S1 [Oscillospiraceae bacterium]
MKTEIIVAEHAGFCFGVDRALKIVYNVLSSGKKVVTYGEIIHNKDVVRDLEKKGVRITETEKALSELTDETVIIRSHGVTKRVLEILKEKEIEYHDGTCPFVKRIQKIAEEKSKEGYDVVIMGDNAHPEVIGIASYCQNMAIICKDDKELSEFLKKKLKNPEKKVAIVAQTTYNINMWDNCVRLAAEALPDAEVINTICNATSDRQRSAVQLAENADLMVVIGGKHSSNTVKLAEICSRHCKECIHVENASELDFQYIAKLLKNNIGEKFTVGVTAGASAPVHIIKEVTNQMSEKMIMEEDFNFEEALDASFKKIYTGQRVKGYITAVNDAEAIVDVGTKHTGYVSLDELTNDPALKPADVVKPGDEVELIVIKVNDAEGIVTLSKKKVDALLGFDKIVKAKEEDAILEGTVTGVVKGGVIVLYEGIRVFIPASQATARRDDKLEELVKTTVKFKIIEANEQRGKAVGSIRIVRNAEKDAAKAKFWESVNVNDVFKGEVKSLTTYGAFVDLGGIDGMVHISELSWNRIKHPSEVVNVGDVIEVYVKELDKEANRISLGYKKTEDNPWVKFANEYKVDDVVKAKVVSITPFGAFAQIIPGIDGLIHISQIADKRVTNVKDVLAIGDEVDAKITEIDIDKKRISISMRALIETAAEEAPVEE